MKANETLKAEAERQHVKLWEIAAKFGITDGQFSRWLRVEFSPERMQQALLYIREIAEEHQQGQGAGV